IVEEMAIASGVRVPEAWVMEGERGINAFAAGWTVSGAVVAVTRGTLEQLTRDELQGVIGHEFSHILNGDMGLNIRMIGVLAGIAGALDQIRATSGGALIRGRYAEEMSHLFFGQSIKVYLGGLFDTHPPLDERIRRVNPRFQPSTYRPSRATAGDLPIVEKVE